MGTRRRCFPTHRRSTSVTRERSRQKAGLAPWVDRVTMTIPMFSAARELVFLVVGADKADAARRAFVEPPSRATPASLVRSASGRTVAILDSAAAARLEEQVSD